MTNKKSQINIEVTLDDNQVPDQIHWSATDQKGSGPAEAKAILLALFDKEHLDTLKIDLWTKDMQVAEMDRFFYNTLKSMADTYMRATGNNQLAGAMQQFAVYFGGETEIIPKEGQG